MKQIQTGKTYAESVIDSALQTADNDPKFLAWQQSEAGKKVHEEANRMTREQLIDSILDDLEALGLIQSEKAKA